MKYANYSNSSRIVPRYSGQRAICPNCGTVVTGKIYYNRINHWAHLKKDCDSWYEPISDWHVEWQNHFPKKNRELLIKRNGVAHRADVRLNNGQVIEIQNSPLSISEVKKRESFYGKDSLVWVLNADNLASSCFIKQEFFLYRYKLSIIVPKIIAGTDQYNVQEIIAGILDIDEIIELTQGRNLYQVTEGNTMTFEIIGDGYDFHSSWARYNFYACCVYEGLYREIDLKDFGNSIIIEHRPSNRIISNWTLIKSKWRRFIDHMECPIFIDNLNGLYEYQIFDYRKKEVLDKKVFIDNYLKNT